MMKLSKIQTYLYLILFTIIIICIHGQPILQSKILQQTLIQSEHKLQQQKLTLPPFPSIIDLPYQAHSFNDIDYILQLLKRGVRYFKIDVSLANNQSCLNNQFYSSLPQKQKKCYNTSQYSQQYCCLALRGDTSGRDSFIYPFNTLDQFIIMLQKYLSSRSQNLDTILFFAINHQFKFSFDNVLVENTMYKLGKLMEKYDKLYFGFGMDDFILEYDRICRNLIVKQQNKIIINNYKQQQSNSQIQQHHENILKLNTQICTQQRKYISKSSKFFLQSGSDTPSDPRNYYDRYRNFNVYYQNIITRCTTGFPSWTKKHPQFPLIFWQPSDQYQIQLVLQTFMSTKCRLHHGRDLKGLAITSNIDPEVFQFYLKKITSNVNKTKEFLMFQPNTEKLILKNEKNHLAKIRIENNKEDKLPRGEYLVLGQEIVNEKENVKQLQVILLGVDSTTEKVMQIKRKVLIKTSIDNIFNKIIGNENKFIITLSNTIKNLTQLFIYSSQLQQLSSSSNPNLILLTSYRQSYYSLTNNPNPLLFTITKSSSSFKTNQTLTQFILPINKSQSLKSMLIIQDEQQIIRILLTGSYLKSNEVWIAEIKNGQIYKSHNIFTWGINPSLIIKQSGIILLSSQSSPCLSGLLINNGDTPLCSYYKFQQFSSLLTTPHSINIIQFTYQHLISYLSSFNPPQQPSPVTPCINNFIMYKTLNGKNVEIVQIWQRLFIVTQYVHVSEMGLMNSLFCAPSNFGKINDGNAMIGTVWSRNQFKKNIFKNKNNQSQIIIIKDQ